MPKYRYTDADRMCMKEGLRGVREMASIGGETIHHLSHMSKILPDRFAVLADRYAEIEYGTGKLRAPLKSLEPHQRQKEKSIPDGEPSRICRDHGMYGIKHLSSITGDSEYTLRELYRKDKLAFIELVVNTEKQMMDYYEDES